MESNEDGDFNISMASSYILGKKKARSVLVIGPVGLVNFYYILIFCVGLSVTKFKFGVIDTRLKKN
jgi:hypothetical protein